jgi:hypothetical protein
MFIMRMPVIREKILEMLEQNRGKRFSLEEISRAIGFKSKTTTVALDKLLKNGLIGQPEDGIYSSKLSPLPAAAPQKSERVHEFKAVPRYRQPLQLVKEVPEVKQAPAKLSSPPKKAAKLPNMPKLLSIPKFPQIRKPAKPQKPKNVTKSASPVSTAPPMSIISIDLLMEKQQNSSNNINGLLYMIQDNPAIVDARIRKIVEAELTKLKLSVSFADEE